MYVDDDGDAVHGGGRGGGGGGVVVGGRDVAQWFQKAETRQKKLTWCDFMSFFHVSVSKYT